MAQTKFSQVSGMTVVISTGLLFLVNVIILAVANLVFPTNVVLGTHALSYQWALGMSMGELAVLGAFALPFVSWYERSRQKLFTTAEWMGLYFVLNFVGIWVLTRFSEQFGLGVTSWMVVLGLAIVLDVTQGMAMVAYGSTQQK